MDSKATRERPRRRLTLLDGLALIVGTAIGLAAWRAVVSGLPSLDPATFLVRIVTAPPSGWNGPEVMIRMADAMGVVLMFVGGWTIILPILALRGGRRAWRRSLGKPGTVACVAACVGMILGGAAWAFAASLRNAFGNRPPLPFGSAVRYFLTLELVPLAAFAVAVAWSMQALSGRWRPPRDWADRLGVGVGVLWLVAGLVWSVRNTMLP